MEDLGQLVRDIRTRIGAINLPREQIAPKLGVTYSWLCKFMQERKDGSNPRVDTLEKVLRGLERLERAAQKQQSEARAN